MKKLISFKVLKSICAYEFNSFCERKDCGCLYYVYDGTIVRHCDEHMPKKEKQEE